MPRNHVLCILNYAFFFVISALLVCPVVAADDLGTGFRNPPHESGIRAFWWWLNGNVTREAITRDLEEMKAKGFSGALIFDANGSDQRGNTNVPAGPAFASPEWTKLFVHACKEAKRLDLELSLNIQSGWNLGGPKVSPEEATQQLVWSKTKTNGSGTAKISLASPVKEGSFYRDIVVLAVPLGKRPAENLARATIHASSVHKSQDPFRAMDDDLSTYWVSEDSPTNEAGQFLQFDLSKAIVVSEVSLQGRKDYGPKEGTIQVSSDGETFQKIKDFTLANHEELKVQFDPTQASSLRIHFVDAYDPNPVNNKPRNVQVSEVRIPRVVSEARSETFGVTPIKHLELKSSTVELGSSAPDCRFLLETSHAAPGEPVVKSSEILNLTDLMQESGVLEWEVPQGEWVILRVGHTNTNAHVSTSSAGWGGRVLDYMNPKSLDAYWKRNVEPLCNAIGPLAGTTLRYLHTDSWEGGGMNWTPGFEHVFVEHRGYDPFPWLPVLAGFVVDSREESNAFLADLRKTIGDRVAQHYGQLAKLAGDKGMGTHPECSGPHAGPLDGLKNYGRSELMMSEFWSPSPHRPTKPNRFFVKQAASAAHTYGKRLVGAEGFTTIGPHWNDVPWSAMKPSFDHEFCAGLNLLFNHTFTCSPKEMGSPGQEYFAGTHFNPQVTWWDESPAVIDYFKRCQFLAQQGEFVADVVYYYGDHIPNIATLKESDPPGALPSYDYDVLSEELLLSKLAVEGDRLSLPSGMQYRVLVLPDHRVLSLKALEKINTLVRRGATVLGPKPERAVSLERGEDGRKRFQQLSNSLWGPTKANSAEGIRKVEAGRVAWGMAARELLEKDGVRADVRMTFDDGIPAPDTDWIHYRIGDADVYFIAELGGVAKQIDAKFRVAGKLPELWDPIDGSIREAKTFALGDGCTNIPLRLEAFDSLFVVFRKAHASSRSDGSNFVTWQPTQTIEAPWDVDFDTQQGLHGKTVRFESLASWTDHDDATIKYFSGKAVYRTTFQSEKAGDEPIALQLGQIKDVGIARVRLNGTDLGVVWRPPFRVDITESIKIGQNQLEVIVVNSWRNRLIGDLELSERDRHSSTNIRVTKEWKLEPSGLLGPVVLETQRSP